jgi:predicted transcriptional regulator
MTTRLAKATIGTTVMLRVGTSSERQTSSSLIFKQTLRGGTMKTVILEVRAPGDSMAGFVNAWKTGRAEKSARIAFASPELLWQVLTAKRWELLKTLCGIGPVSIREAARRVGRDVKAVHGDVTALLNAGVLDRAEGGGIIFPFDAVKVEFMLQAA